jgi:hypothetical protein
MFWQHQKRLPYVSSSWETLHPAFMPQWHYGGISPFGRLFKLSMDLLGSFGYVPSCNTLKFENFRMLIGK